MGRGAMPAEANPPRCTLPLAPRGTVPLALLLLTLVGVYVDHPLPQPQDDSVLTFSENRARGTPTTLGRHRRLSLPQPTIRSAASGEEAGRTGGSDVCMACTRVTGRLRGVHRCPPPCFSNVGSRGQGERPTTRSARWKIGGLHDARAVHMSLSFTPIATGCASYERLLPAPMKRCR